jgi:site-specific DNA recombinase
MAHERKVACLYRVSTTKQLDENEIPMQKEACMKMINQHSDWLLVNEYIERGVSGYKTKISDRDEIQRVLRDATKGVFDILVLFSSDRLCRIQDDYTPILKKLSKYVEVWSYTQGDITIRTHTDALKASIDGWQNEGESIKISLRTDEKHKQMTENGEFRGGSAPYGYRLELSGKFNKRDKKQRKELFDMVVDEYESDVVKQIFNLVYECGYGGNRIAKYLNENGIKTRTGKSWSMSTINYMLRNPIYKGYLTYGKRTCKEDGQFNQPSSEWIVAKEKSPELEIIPEEIWNKIALIRKERNPISDTQITSLPTKGKLLFVGFIRCGHCNSPLVTTHHNKKWINKDGTERTTTKVKYRCSGHQSKRTTCDGFTSYSKDKIEEPILQYVEDYLSQLAQYDYTKEHEKENKDVLRKMHNELDILIKEREKKYEQIKLMQNEIPNTLTGDSPYTKEELNEIIIRFKKEVEQIRVKVLEHEEKIKIKENELNEIKLVKKYVIEWKEIFYKSPIEKQKMMLASIIDNIIIYRDRFEVNVKIHVQQFVNAVMGVQNNTTGEHTLDGNTPQTFIEKQIIIELAKLELVG